MIHHSIFISVTHFVLSETYFRKPFAWLSLAELSTPFLHVRWLLAATGRKGESKSNDRGSEDKTKATTTIKREKALYQWASVGFAVTFLSTRTFGYGLGLLDLWRSHRYWKEINGLWGVVVGLHLGYALNLFWSVKVGSSLLRALVSKKQAKKKSD